MSKHPNQAMPMKGSAIHVGTIRRNIQASTYTDVRPPWMQIQFEDLERDQGGDVFITMQEARELGKWLTKWSRPSIATRVYRLLGWEPVP
jgi:hypothetical protein